MAHISGGIMAAYIAFGIEPRASADRGDHDGAGHADDGEDVRARRRRCPRRSAPSSSRSRRTDVNVIDAAGRGTGEGLQLAINVGAMLISFVALIALVNAIAGGVGRA